MNPIHPDLLLAALAEALETMAFIAVEPAPDNAPADDALQVALDFSGLLDGRVSLSAPAALGALIAANLAALEPDAVSPAQAADALRELANITAGLLLRQLCADHEMPQLQVPVVAPSATQPHVLHTCRAALNADGHPVTLSLETCS